MPLGLENFRQVGTGVFDLDRKVELKNDSLQKSGSTLAARFQGWTTRLISSLSGVTSTEKSNVEDLKTKQTFLSALAKAEGAETAQRALEAAGLPKDWATNNQPLSTRTIKVVLDQAQTIRLATMRDNTRTMNQVLTTAKLQDSDARLAVVRAIKNTPNFATTRLSAAEMSQLAQVGLGKLSETKQKLCTERFPNLSRWIKSEESTSHSSVKLDPSRLVPDLQKNLVSSNTLTANDPVYAGLALLNEATELLGKSSPTLEGLKTIQDNIKDLKEKIQNNLSSLFALSEKDPIDANDSNTKFTAAVFDDLVHQLELLDAKSTYLDTVADSHPLSTKAVAQNNLLWVQASDIILENFIAEQEAQGQTIPSDQIRQSWQGVKEKYNAALTEASNNNQSVEAPSSKNKTTHPVVVGKKEVLGELEKTLQQAGLKPAQIKSLLSEQAMQGAQRTALARSESWLPIENNMIIMRDGALRTYKSTIIPGQYIDARFEKKYTNPDTGKIEGVSAATSNDATHARNLKLSQLSGPDGKPMITVVGHGVLDMWTIKDDTERVKANKAGALEVLEAGIAKNDRLRAVALSDTPAATPVEITHVSVNLISPDSLRSLVGLKDYQERDYTLNQFDAFEANSGLQELGMDNGQGNGGEVKLKANVNTITFSFGINGIATNPVLSGLMRVWPNVHAHNTQNMIKLVGDLGNLDANVQGSAGTRPGGFIGTVYDRLEAAAGVARAKGDTALERALEEKMSGLRESARTVRALFTNEAFARGNGDTAKMGREIIALQGLAEQSLALIEAKDMAATVSKGCKSDKDRGGVTDVEVKTKLIVDDMGGRIVSDTKLSSADQGVYNTVSVSSGQLENQRWNTGVGGSKEAGHLKDRLPDIQVRQHLAGLGKFTKA